MENKQHKQLKLGDLFCRNNIKLDSKSEWCKALGFKIENIRGDGNCLYTNMGKSLEMNGNQVRKSIVEKANIYWSDIFEFDSDGEEFLNFLSEASDKKQWGGARQVTIFAKMKDVKVYIHSHGNIIQTLNYDSGDEQ
eukprot:10568792-Heterocapsa_arctica.AAC.1